MVERTRQLPDQHFQLILGDADGLDRFVVRGPIQGPGETFEGVAVTEDYAALVREVPRIGYPY